MNLGGNLRGLLPMRQHVPGSDSSQDQSGGDEEDCSAIPAERSRCRLLLRTRREPGWFKTRIDCLNRGATLGIRAQTLSCNGGEWLRHRLGHGWLSGSFAIPKRRIFGKNLDQGGSEGPEIRSRLDGSKLCFRRIADGSRRTGYDGCAHGADAVGGELEAVAGGHDVRGIETAVDEPFGVQIRERGQGRSEHVASFLGC